MDILDLIDEATKEADAYEHHPARELPLEEQLLYLYGLSLVMNADADVDDEEKEYLRILIKSFEMDQSTLEECVAFAQAPDKDTIQAFFRTYRRRPIAQLFLFDALMMSRRDNKIEEKETQVLMKMAQQLEVAKGTYQDIYDLFCHIKNKDWDESSLYFSTHLLNPNHFKHLLDYFEVDFEELTANYTELKQNRLQTLLRERIQGEEKGIPNEVLLPLFQTALDRNELKVPQGDIVFNEKEIITVAELGFDYCQDGKYFTIKEEKIIHHREVYWFFMTCTQIKHEFLHSLINDKKYCEVIELESNGRMAKLSWTFTRNDTVVVINNIFYIYSEDKNTIYDSSKIYISEDDNFENYMDDDIESNNEINLWYDLNNNNSRGKLVKPTNEQIADLLLSE